MKHTTVKGSAGPAKAKVTPIARDRANGDRAGLVGEGAARPDRQTSEAFVGRAREMGELRRGLEDALAGRGRLVLLAGEPGIGKTRLAQEIGAEAEDRGFAVFWGRCHEDEGAPPYWPWVQILRAHVRACDATTLRVELGPGGEDIARILEELRERLPDLPLPAAMEPAAARFRLFDSVTALLRNAAERQPLVLVLDDLHWADASALLLLRFVAREMARLRLFVVGTYRDVEVAPMHSLFATLGELAREPVTRRLLLSGLTQADVARYLEAAAGITPAAPLVAGVTRDTAGNPFLVGEVARWLLAEGGQSAFHDRRSAVGIPPGARAVISRRLQRFSVECNELLRIAAVIGREFDLTILGGASGLAREQLLAALEAPVTARLVMEVPGSLARYRFSHALVRETIYEELSLTGRSQLHRQVLDAMAPGAGSVGSESLLAELAHHAFEAARGGNSADVDEAIAFAKRAGDHSMQALAYEEAASHYERALEALDGRPACADQRERVELLRALGVACARADLPPEKTTAALERAVELAERLGDAELQAATALEYHGAVRQGPLMEACAQVPALERALAALGPSDSVLRVRLLAALVRAGPRWAARKRLGTAREARAMAERVGDPEARIAALGALHAALLGPDHTEERLAISTEQMQLADTFQPGAWIWAAQDLVLDLCELGEMAEMDRLLQRAYRIIDDKRVFYWSGFKPLWKGMRAATEGRFEEAERLASDLFTFAERTRQRDFQNAAWGVVYELRRSQGRLAEMDAVVLHAPPEDAWPADHVALLHLELGRTDRASEWLDRLAEKDFADIQRGYVFLPTMLRIAIVAHRLRDEKQCAVLYDILLPYAARNIVHGYAVQCCGSVAYPLGMLATTLGRYTDAERHFESALAFNRRIGARPWIARSEYEYAVMLAARGRAEDREKLTDLLARAVDTFEAVGMKSDLDRALQLRNRMGLASGAVEPGGDAPVSTSDSDESARRARAAATFRREVDYWTLSYGGVTARVRDMKGLHYIAHLLRHPDREFHVLDLVQASGVEDRGSSGNRRTETRPQGLSMLDGPAKAAYARRLAELRAELEEAEQFHDAGRAASTREEIDALTEQLATAVGLGGRDRLAASDAERARSAVTHGIKAALRRIRPQIPMLADALARSIKTGTYCVYSPDPAYLVDWAL